MILSLYLILACGVPRPVSKGGKEFLNGCIFSEASGCRNYGLKVEVGRSRDRRQKEQLKDH